MVTIEGIPLLEYQIRLLVRYDIRDIIILTGFLAEKIESFFQQGKAFGVHIQYHREKKPLGTTGGLKEIEDRTRVAGGEIVKLFGNGSAFYAPAQSAIEMAESFIRDKMRVIPCVSLCEGEFGIDGYFIGVPTVIGSNGVEKILEFPLTDNEKSELNKTLKAVKNTVKETGL